MNLSLPKLTALALIAAPGAEARWQPFAALRGSAALSSVCTDLGDAAAEHVVKDNWCKPDGSSAYGISDWRADCKQVAYGVCKGKIPDVAGRWCPDERMTTSDLLSLQDECEDQVDSMVGADDDDDTNRRPDTDPCSPDVIFKDQPPNKRAGYERSANNGTLKQDHPDVWHDTKQARNKCKQQVGANECKSMGYCFAEELEDYANAF